MAAVTRPTEWLSKWIVILTASLYFVAVVLRAWLFFRDRADMTSLGRALALLALWLLLLVSAPALFRRWPAYFFVYLVIQTALVFVLISLPGAPDFIGALLGVLSMQVMLRTSGRIGALWIGLCAVVLALLLWGAFQYQAIALALIYTAGNVFLGSYTRTIRRAQAAHVQNLALAGELEQANRQLQAYSAQLEQLAVARERNRLARELHDSVTQTVFSMNLTTQSAALLFDQDQERLAAQLERLYTLARSALAEMQVLIAELAPVRPGAPAPPAALPRLPLSPGLPEALEPLLADDRFNGLKIAVEVDGNLPLEPAEEQALFRILQEALHNIVKHAGVSQAAVRLHLQEPAWVEVEDQGRGFDPRQAQRSGHIGLSGMRERAAEIGWRLHVASSPGAGTRIRLEKLCPQEVVHGNS